MHRRSAGSEEVRQQASRWIKIPRVFERIAEIRAAAFDQKERRCRRVAKSSAVALEDADIRTRFKHEPQWLGRGAGALRQFRGRQGAVTDMSEDVEIRRGKECRRRSICKC